LPITCPPEHTRIAGRPDAWRQRLGRLRSVEQRRIPVARAALTGTADLLQHALHHGPADPPAGRARLAALPRTECRRHEVPGTVCREPALDVRPCDLRDAERAGLLQ